MPYQEGPMTEAMYYVLLALSKPTHGYQLMLDIKEISGGRIEMGPGTLYGVLTRLLKENLLRIKQDDGRRKTYELTIQGRIALKSEYERLKSMLKDGAFLEGE
ncbi:PadR family transcriptional regulator [Anaerocolumna chitinilytica]|uniref:PadR family transcriptional regulator n=1 Tax=Anaerocolumna chitinilytica TaxID=1727145 RepID=A0A7I8DFG4_9FIRM|nr:helix-turn-helix transcriptional regulator [Anaerocolumna chitinilytica]BCJ97209.1 PadR family transcriptional regulator [Anaerocolumna chitinilytica]